MSAGLQLLRALIDNGSNAAAQDLRPEMFIAQERPVYDFVTAFHHRYGALPSVAVAAQQGFVLPAAEGPIAYFIDRVRDRAVYNIVSENIPAFQEAIASRNIQALREILATMNRDAGALNARSEVMTAIDAAAMVLADYEDAHRSPNGFIRGIPTGYGPLDHTTGGFVGGDIIAVAARPNIGKSYKLISCALNSWRAGHSVVFVTMEMTTLQTMRRMLALMAGINPNHIRSGRLTMHGETILHDVVEGLGDLPPLHVMSGNFKKTTTDIDRLMLTHLPDIAYIDAAYLVAPEKRQRRDGSRWEAFYQVGEEFKGIAIERHRPLVITVQLNRTKKRGVESDLDQIAGGDVVGQIATVVLQIDKPEGMEDAEARRQYDLTKNREGQLIKYQTRFTFDPPNLDVLGVVDSNGALREWVPPEIVQPEDPDQPEIIDDDTGRPLVPDDDL